MVFCGDDALMAEFAQAGCSGLVSVASNAWPDETHLYVRQCLLSTLKDKNVWEKASNSLFICSNPVPVKHLLFKRGDISSSKMAPPLSHLDMPSSDAVLDADSQIKTWFKKEV
jgi:4-hydroxy-tetrahydrodipicolinate synthase